MLEAPAAAVLVMVPFLTEMKVGAAANAISFVGMYHLYIRGERIEKGVRASHVTACDTYCAQLTNDQNTQDIACRTYVCFVLDIARTTRVLLGRPRDPRHVAAPAAPPSAWQQA